MSWFAAKPGQLIRRLAHIKAGFGRVGATVSNQTAQDVAGQAHVFVHIRSGDTDRSIRVVKVNQYVSGVIATGPGAVAEERRGGEHAFLTRAVQAVEPQALENFKQAILSELQE